MHPRHPLTTSTSTPRHSPPLVSTAGGGLSQKTLRGPALDKLSERLAEMAAGGNASERPPRAALARAPASREGEPETPRLSPRPTATGFTPRGGTRASPMRRIGSVRKSIGLTSVGEAEDALGGVVVGRERRKGGRAHRHAGSFSRVEVR